MIRSLMAVAVGAALLVGNAANAAVVTIFDDDFSSDLANTGGSVLNYTSFNNFSVSGGGTVDLVKSGDYGITCTYGGACVDLDGSTSASGFLSSTVLNFYAGFIYTFDLAITGNQRLSTLENGTFGISNGVLSAFYNNLSQNFSFDSFVSGGAFNFSVAADTTGSIFFQDNGADNVGAVLDRVRITKNIPSPVPLPASALLLLGGIGGLGALRRRKTAA